MLHGPVGALCNFQMCVESNRIEFPRKFPRNFRGDLTALLDSFQLFKDGPVTVYIFAV